MRGFDPRDLERELGIDDDSLRQHYGDQVNIGSTGAPPPPQRPGVEPVVIPPNQQISPRTPAHQSSAGSPTLWDRFRVTLRVSEDMAGPHRYTRAITYTLPFAFAALLMNPLLVPMTMIVWYLVLVAFGRHIRLKVYGILLGVALALGVLGLIGLHLFPWLYDTIR